MTWAVKFELPVKQKIVLLMLANRTNSDDGKCIPSMDRLARDCGMSKDSVKRAIKELSDAGLIEVVHRREGATMLSNQYRLKMGGVGAHSTGGRCTQHRGVGAHSTPNQRVEPENIIREDDPDGSSDLFSAENPTDHQEKTPDKIETGFKEFWDEIWPAHKRKTGRVECEKVYRQACLGKHPKAKLVAPDDLNAAARRYIASVQDREYLKGPLPWLRLPGWEAFLGAPEKKPLTYAQQVIRDYGVRP